MNSDVGQSDRFDQLLQGWAEERLPTDEALDRLREQIAAAVAEGKQPKGGIEETGAEPFFEQPLHRPRRNQSRPWSAVSTAAAVLVLSGIWLVRPSGLDGPRTTIPPEGTSAQTPAIVELEPGHLAAKAVLLSEMERLFEQRVGWVAEIDGQVRMGLADDPQGAGKAVAVRLVVLRRTATDSEWTPVWSADVVSRPEELVRIAPQSSSDALGNARISLWTHTLSDGMIMVESAFAVNGAIGMEATHSGLQEPGRPVNVYSLHRDGVEYQVYQTVAVLDELI